MSSKPSALARIADRLEGKVTIAQFRAEIHGELPDARIPAAAILRQLDEHGVDWCEQCETLHDTTSQDNLVASFPEQCQCKDQP